MPSPLDVVQLMVSGPAGSQTSCSAITPAALRLKGP